MGETPYLLTCAASGAGAAVLALMAWRRRAAAPAAAPLAVFFLAVALWDIAYAVDEGFGSSRVGLFVMYCGVAAATPSAFLFVAHLGHFDAFLHRGLLIALTCASVLIALSAATDARLHLLFNGYLGHDRLLREHAGPVFWINIAYDYALLAGTTALVLVYLRRNRHRLYRRQSRAMLIGVIVPWASSLGLVFNLTTRDMTPLALSITAILFAAAMWRYRGLTVVPIARHLVVERMADGVIVLDEHDLVSDMNPAAATMFRAGADAVGRQLESVPVLAMALMGLDRNVGSHPLEFVIPDASTPRHVEITAHPLEDRRGRATGSLIVVRDVTHRVRLERELEHLASTDSLTGIGNRRRFDERLELEHARAVRTAQPLTLVVIDLDRLKEINDASGHRAGDAALRRVAHHVADNVRRIDLPARIGGDEFAVLLPETSGDEALPVVQRILAAVEADRDPQLAGAITVSVGVATIDARERGIGDVMRMADDAMYRAKDAGRNRIEVAVDR